MRVRCVRKRRKSLNGNGKLVFIVPPSEIVKARADGIAGIIYGKR